MTIQELALVAREMIDAISRNHAKDWDRYKAAKLRLQDMIGDVLGADGQFTASGKSMPNQPVPNAQSLQTLAKWPGNSDRCGSIPQLGESRDSFEDLNGLNPL